MWEYKLTESDADHKAEKKLNQAVGSGWELAEFKMRRNGMDQYVFLPRRSQ